MLNKNKAIFTFGDFRLDVGEARLTHRGRVIALAPKAFSMLVLLVEHAGELIQKEDILRVLWPDSFVEEANLTVHISALRKALATEDNEQFIETVPKRGYRFSAPVSTIEPIPVLETPPDSPAIPEQPQHSRRHPWFAVTGVLVFAAMVGWWGMKTVESKTPPAIAVLPFQTLSPSTGQDHCLGIGMADALINRLATLPEFNVRTTGQVREFDKSGVDAVAAARELKAEWVLTGSLQHLDRSLRVTVQLIRGGTGKTIWAEKYDEPFTNIFSVEDEISEKLARTLAPRLSGGAQQILMRRSTANPEAFRLYAEGRVESQRLVSGSDARARDLFERAIQLDPTYPQPYIGLVDVLMENWYQEPEHRAQYETRIRECIATVRKLDPEWPELYMASGWVAEILATRLAPRRGRVQTGAGDQPQSCGGARIVWMDAQHPRTAHRIGVGTSASVRAEPGGRSCRPEVGMGHLRAAPFSRRVEPGAVGPCGECVATLLECDRAACGPLSGAPRPQ